MILIRQNLTNFMEHNDAILKLSYKVKLTKNIPQKHEKTLRKLVSFNFKNLENTERGKMAGY